MRFENPCWSLGHAWTDLPIASQVAALLSFALDQLFQDRFRGRHPYIRRIRAARGWGGAGLVQMADEHGLLSSAARERFLPVFKWLVTIAANARADEPFSRRSTPFAGSHERQRDPRWTSGIEKARLSWHSNCGRRRDRSPTDTDCCLDQWPRLRGNARACARLPSECARARRQLPPNGAARAAIPALTRPGRGARRTGLKSNVWMAQHHLIAI